MEEKEKGQQGKGNTFQQVNQIINIGTVQHFNNGVEKVENNYYCGVRQAGNAQSSDSQGDTSSTVTPSPANSPIPRETAPLREQILLYVSCLSGQVADAWKSRYMKMWEDILDLEVVAADVYNPGKQQGTNFNRNLVANIIHYLGNRGRKEDCVYKDYNAAQYTEKLEGDKEHSVRAALGQNPSEKIASQLDRLMKTNSL